jgi:hypothetical protein
MAEAEAAGKAAGKGFGALGQKVGPLPLYVWIIAAVGIWYYMQKKQLAASAATAPAAGTAAASPSSGFSYPQDNSGFGGGGGGASGTQPSGGSTVANQYPDNASWSRAAINYLVGIGIDPTTANEAIQQYLSSQALTPSEQADVNLAIQALGAPPTAPGPVGISTTPVVTPPGGNGNTNTGTTTGTTTGGTTTGGTTMPTGGATSISQFGTFYPGTSPPPGVQTTAGVIQVPSGKGLYVGYMQNDIKSGSGPTGLRWVPRFTVSSSIADAPWIQGSNATPLQETTFLAQGPGYFVPNSSATTPLTDAQAAAAGLPVQSSAPVNPNQIAEEKQGAANNAIEQAGGNPFAAPAAAKPNAKTNSK